MYAVYELLTDLLSGKESKDWQDWSVDNGIIVEKRLLQTVSAEKDAQTLVTTYELSGVNSYYYTNLD